MDDTTPDCRADKIVQRSIGRNPERGHQMNAKEEADAARRAFEEEAERLLRESEARDDQLLAICICLLVGAAILSVLFG